MRTETAVQQYWSASLAWKRVPGYVEGQTIETLFRTLDPLEYHPTHSIARQAKALSDMIVKGKIRRKAQKRRKNVIQFPIRVRQDTIAA
jgi:hypothetical protein